MKNQKLMLIAATLLWSLFSLTANATAPTEESVQQLKEIRSNALIAQDDDVIFYDVIDPDGNLSGGAIDIDDTNREGIVGSGVLDETTALDDFEYETIIGDDQVANRIHIVFVGDGYTESDLSNYAAHTNYVINTFFDEEPFLSYKNLFAVHRVDVISNESGVDNDPNEGVEKDTALNMYFFCQGIERLLCVSTGLATEAAYNAPRADQIIVLANSSKYGGAGYGSNIGTVAGANSYAPRIAEHEFGHSFGDLADEYDYGGSETYTGSEPSRANNTIYTEDELLSMQTKWYRWLDLDNVTTLEGADTHVYGIYRPTSNSKMRNLGRPWDPVNTEQLIINIYKVIDPIETSADYGNHPQGDILTISTIDIAQDTLEIQWYFDGNAIDGANGTSFDTASLGELEGKHTVSVRVVDTTDQVRDEAARANYMTGERIWNIIGSDTTPPEITLLGNSHYELYVGDSFTDPGATAYDNVDGDITSNIIRNGSISTTTIGSYTVTYDVTDSSGNPALTVTRTANVSPLPECLEYSSSLSIHESLGRAYSRTETTAGWWWNPGTTTTTWYSSGSNEALGTNGSTIVTVHEKPLGYFKKGSCPEPDTTAPVITLVGDNPLTVYQGTTFSDPGATANDNADGNISSSIIVSGSVNTSVIGTYTLRYNVEDSSGNVATEVTRTVEVVSQPACIDYSSTVSQHETAGRAYSQTSNSGWWWSQTTVTTWYAEGSGENLGTNGNATLSLKEQPPGYFEQGTCPVGPENPEIDSISANVNGNNVTISGTASDLNDDITSVSVEIDGEVITCNGTYSWRCEFIDLNAGQYTAIATATDARDAHSTPVSVEFIIQAPSAPTVNIATSSVQGNNLVVTGTVSDINNNVASVTMGFPGEYTANCSLNGNTFSCTLNISNLLPGDYQVELFATDTTNLDSETEVIEFTVTDGTAPVITNVNPSTSSRNLTVTASVNDQENDTATVVLEYENGTEVATCSGTTSTSCSINNHEVGTFTFRLAAYDDAGHKGISDTFTVTFTEGPVCITALNSEHISAGRAVLRYGLLTYAVGSNAYLGFQNATTNLEETSTGVWSVCSN